MLEPANGVSVAAVEAGVEVTIGVEGVETETLIAGEAVAIGTLIAEEDEETSIVVGDEGLTAEDLVIQGHPAAEILEKGKHIELRHPESQIRTFLPAVVEDAMIEGEFLHRNLGLRLFHVQNQDLAHHPVDAAVLHLLVVGLGRQIDVETLTEGEVLNEHLVGDHLLPLLLVLAPQDPPNAEDQHLRQLVCPLLQGLEDLAAILPQDPGLPPVREAELQEEGLPAVEIVQHLDQHQQQMKKWLKPLLGLVGVVMIANIG